MKIIVEEEKSKKYESININTRNNPELLPLDSNQEINFDFSKCDEEIILKSKIEVKQLLSNYYREFTYLDDNKDVIKRYAIFNKEREEINKKVLLKGKLSFLSKKDIKIKNIKKKSNEELLEHFYNIIDSMKENESFKDVLKDILNTNLKMLDTILPILYYDDELKKNVWYIPNFKGSNDDIILDYETEIPLFSSNFMERIYSHKFHINYFLINKKGIEVFSSNFNTYSGNIKNVRIKNIEIDKDKFYFSSLKSHPSYNNFAVNNLSSKELYIKSDKELTEDYFKVNDDDRTKLSIPFPNISFLDDEQTNKILEMTNSSKTLKDIKSSLKNYSKHLDINDESLDKYNQMLDHNLFVSKDFNPNFFDFNKENVLNDLCIKDKKINLLKMQMEEDFITKAKSIKNKNNEEYFIIKSKEDLEYLLPKDNEYNKNINKIDNFNLMFSKSHYSESTFIKFKVKSLEEKSIYDLDDVSELKSDILEVENHQFVIHTNKNKLFYIDTKKHNLELIDNTKKIVLFDKKMIKLLNLNNDNINLVILQTDNNIIYLPKEKINKYSIKLESKKENLGFLKVEKNDEGNYIFKTVLPLTNNARRSKYEIGDEKINFKNENGELRLNIDDNDNQTEMFLEYEFKEDFFKLLSENIKSEQKREQKRWDKIKKENQDNINNYIDEALKNNKPETLPEIKFLDETLVNMKINNIKINKDYSLMFLNKLQMKEDTKDTTFNIKTDENNMIIDITDRKSKFSKYLLIHNFKNNYNVSFYANNDVNSNELFNLIKTNKILTKIDNIEMEKEVLFSKDKMYVLDKFSTSTIFDIDYKKTKEIENSIVNHKKSLSFSNKNGDFDLVLDGNKKIKSLEDSKKRKKMYEAISSYGSSLI